MSRVALAGVLIGVALCSRLAVDATGALARGQTMSIRGIVIGLGGGSMQVQTPSGGVTVNFANTCHVLRLVAGSGADVRPNRWAQLQLVKGTTLIDTLRIDLTVRGPAGPHRGPAVLSDPAGRAVVAPQAGFHSVLASRHHDGSWLDAERVKGEQQGPIVGKIISVRDNAVTIRIRRDRTSTYYMTSNTYITLVMSGRIGDLSVGQTVQVDIDRTRDVATMVTIVDA